jgi:hypothetical protein
MSELLGKTVVIGVTCLNRAGEQIDSFQTFGTIEEVTDVWIGVRRDGFSELFGLPPAPALLEPAEAGTYTMRSSGAQIEDPDYTVSLSARVIDPESLLEIRGVGFAPS